jgi:flagellar hook-length control protein FliK
MSIQPLLNSSPVAEPAGQRRRAAERDAGPERESFVLPREETASESPAPVRENARQTSRDVGAARSAADETTGSSEKPSDSDGKPEGRPAASETGAKAAAAETGKPTGKIAEAVPAAKPAVSPVDIGALVSIAAAAQAEGQPGQAAKTSDTAGKTTGETKGETKGETLEGQKAEGEAATAGTELKLEGAAVVVAPVIPPDLTAQPVPVQILPTALAAGVPVAGDGEESDLSSGKARPVTAAVVPSLAAVREGLPAAAAPAGEGATAASPAPTPKSGLPASASEALALPVAAGQAAPPDIAKDGSDNAVQTQAQGFTPAQASTPADLKPIEALQQALNPIDLSALGQQGAARPEPLRILTMPEQIAGQASTAAQGQVPGQSQPTPLHVLPIEIGLRALAGARQFDIRLDPGELGRVDVNLSISDNGEVTARMVVDRVETLHLLQRDARTLERAFEQAGLKPSDAGVDITLRDPSDQSGFRQNRQQDEAPQRARILANGSEAGEDTSISTQSAPVRRFVRLGGVDLSV